MHCRAKQGLLREASRLSLRDPLGLFRHRVGLDARTVHWQLCMVVEGTTCKKSKASIKGGKGVTPAY